MDGGVASRDAFQVKLTLRGNNCLESRSVWGKFLQFGGVFSPSFDLSRFYFLISQVRMNPLDAAEFGMILTQLGAMSLSSSSSLSAYVFGWCGFPLNTKCLPE